MNSFCKREGSWRFGEGVTFRSYRMIILTVQQQTLLSPSVLTDSCTGTETNKQDIEQSRNSMSPGKMSEGAQVNEDLVM